eukprot:TRINITY_DN4260_c0_g1_i4.p1 TRINITY_DN4260_c0_g1~~TRINITY_DN4260_c0_g1_i4.p1  ORF type:complete len:432 (+),score=62.17 TRINITY_DN4260_c0_g1_i4:60-1355(+)
MWCLKNVRAHVCTADVVAELGEGFRPAVRLLDHDQLVVSGGRGAVPPYKGKLWSGTKEWVDRMGPRGASDVVIVHMRRARGEYMHVPDLSSLETVLQAVGFPLDKALRVFLNPRHVARRKAHVTRTSASESKTITKKTAMFYVQMESVAAAEECLGLRWDAEPYIMGKVLAYVHVHQLAGRMFVDEGHDDVSCRVLRKEAADGTPDTLPSPAERADLPAATGVGANGSGIDVAATIAAQVSSNFSAMHLHSAQLAEQRALRMLHDAQRLVAAAAGVYGAGALNAVPMQWRNMMSMPCSYTDIAAFSVPGCGTGTVETDFTALSSLSTRGSGAGVTTIPHAGLADAGLGDGGDESRMPVLVVMGDACDGATSQSPSSIVTLDALPSDTEPASDACSMDDNGPDRCLVSLTTPVGSPLLTVCGDEGLVQTTPF